MADDDRGTNGATRDDILFFKGVFRNDEKAIEDARAFKKRNRRRAKARGIEVKILDDVIKEEKRQDETTLEGLKTFKQYAQWAGLPIGTQLSFLDSPRRKREQEDATDKAKRQGYEDGLSAAPRDEMAYPPLSEIGMAYAAEYDRGQDIQRDRFLDLNRDEEPPATKKAPQPPPAEEGDGATVTGIKTRRGRSKAKPAEKVPREELKDEESSPEQQPEA